jgi:hypothetical protein
MSSYARTLQYPRILLLALRSGHYVVTDNRVAAAPRTVNICCSRMVARVFTHQGIWSGSPWVSRPPSPRIRTHGVGRDLQTRYKQRYLPTHRRGTSSHLCRCTRLPVLELAPRWGSRE